MESKLDNTNNPNGNPLEVPNVEASYYVPDVEEVVEPEVEEVADTDEDAEVAELADVGTEDSSSEVAEPVVEVAKPSKPLSKEESKIVALKRQNQKLLDDYRTLNSKLEEIESNKEHASLKSQYINRGMDEDYADQLAKKDVETKQYASKLEVLEFKLDNDEILRQYPDSKKDLNRIMSNVKSTGMTVEQVCRGLYGFEPEREVRAKQAAKGELVESEPDTSVSKAQRSAETVTATTLSVKDLTKKKDYERLWRGGNKMTNAEYLAIKNTYNL